MVNKCVYDCASLTIQKIFFLTYHLFYFFFFWGGGGEDNKWHKNGEFQG